MENFTVLGTSGFVGGHLASRLSLKGYHVLRPSRGELQSLSGRHLGHVFYCLGKDNTRADPYEAFKAHIAWLADVLQFCPISSLTYLSSTRIYLGSPQSREDSELHILPDDDNAIFNGMKIAAEQICFVDRNPAVRAVRLSNVVGFAPRGISLIPTLIRDAIEHGKMRLTISPQSSRDYIAIDDVLDILPRIALGGKWRCYNLASGLNLDLGEIVNLIQGEIPCVSEWRPDAPTVSYPVINIDRIRSEFSFTPRAALDALLSACSQFRAQLRG